LNKKVMALVTRMDGFLGNSTGNLIEIKEAVETLKARGSEEIKEIAIELGKPFLTKNKIAENEDKAEQILKEKLENCEAYDCFQKMVIEQDGEEKFLHSLKEYPKTKIISEVRSPERGFINEWNGEMIGEALNRLGAGRKGKKSRIDHSVSIYFHKKVGEQVEKGDLIAEIFANNYDKLDEADSILSQAIRIEKKKKEEKPLILKRFV
ncbi:MAG: hypothetical protein KAS39_08740, partial [Actinomycetia bacterium]|nr:hypothetical protein [Actinomycetes bacterium]